MHTWYMYGFIRWKIFTRCVTRSLSLHVKNGGSKYFRNLSRLHENLSWNFFDSNIPFLYWNVTYFKFSIVLRWLQWSTHQSWPLHNWTYTHIIHQEPLPQACCVNGKRKQQIHKNFASKFSWKASWHPIHFSCTYSLDNKQQCAGYRMTKVR